MKTSIPPFILRISLLIALVGAFIGITISWANGDEIGWSLLRGAILFLVFGIVSRWWLGSMATAWLESRLETLHAKAKIPEARPGNRPVR